MPFTPDDLISVPINQGSVDVDTVHVAEIGFALPPTDIGSSVGRVIVSYGNTVDAVFTEIKREEFLIPSADLLPIMNAAADGAKTLYENIKDQVYTWLSTNGKLPSGTVS